MGIKRASVDIGSNSCLLLAGEVDDGQLARILANESRVTGLGRDLDKNGRFLDVAMEETYAALAEYKNICGALGISAADITATATEASRVSSNAGDFFRKVKKNLGIDVSVITSEGEAHYSAKGIMLGAEEKTPLAIMDIGGASTEFILTTSSGDIERSFSLPVGSVRAVNWISEGTWDEKFGEIARRWSGELSLVNAKVLHCVAGTMTSLANMRLGHKSFAENEVHGHVLNKEDILRMEKELRDYTPEMFLSRFPFLGKRSAAIKGGLELVVKLSPLLNVERFQVSVYGLRYGTLLAGEIETRFLA